ncbi:MAG: hypothetical protein PUD47_11110, partial [Bacteroidales bacterium]|nr:hypothetical protein [Bacteroidales bacterium]
FPAISRPFPGHFPACSDKNFPTLPDLFPTFINYLYIKYIMIFARLFPTSRRSGNKRIFCCGSHGFLLIL